MTLALSLKSLTKQFRSVTAVDNVSLDVEQGAFVALLGPSGSGKTTMLRMLAGFDIPSSGEIHIAGRSVAGLPPAERNIGMVFQHYALFPHLTVRRNVEYGLKMRGWVKRDREARVNELLAIVRLEALAERLPRQLSGGQQQRIAIARALAYAPNILLMDEPLGALDRALRVEMAEEIRRIHRTFGTTFIYVTHDRDEAMTLADRVLIMHSGKVVADDNPEALFQKPTSALVAKFFSGMNVVKELELSGEGGNVLAISPLAIRFEEPDEPHFAIRAAIRDRLFLGDKVQLVLTAPQLESPLIVHVPTLDSGKHQRDDAVIAYVVKRTAIQLTR
jgi:putative spermidine/putrescine transport system ATP-binding protein